MTDKPTDKIETINVTLYEQLEKLMMERDVLEERIADIRWSIQDDVERNGPVDNAYVSASMSKASVSVSYDKKHVEKAITMLSAFLATHETESTAKETYLHEILSTLEKSKTESQRSASLRIKFK
jgi:hypothetical protein